MFPFEVTERLSQLLDQVLGILETTRGRYRTSDADRMLDRWLEKTVSFIGQFAPTEAARLRGVAQGFVLTSVRAERYVRFIAELTADIENDEEYWENVIHEAFSGDEHDDDEDEDGPPVVFIGHGRSRLWIQVERFLEKEMELAVESFERETRSGEYVGPLSANLRETRSTQRIKVGRGRESNDAETPRENER